MGSASSEMAHFGENAVIFEILRKCQVSFKFKCSERIGNYKGEMLDEVSRLEDDLLPLKDTYRLQRMTYRLQKVTYRLRKMT